MAAARAITSSKDGTFIKQCPPLGDTVRLMFDDAASSDKNPWRISDHDRHHRETQGVKCDGGTFAQDHTFETVKNYQRRLGAKAAWDVATDTGEIAPTVLVTSTKTQHFSHAAKQLLKRPGFNPKAMCSDTWPHKDDYWDLTCPGIMGRLGLFHFEKRIISTLRKNHIDSNEAVTDLLAALHSYCPMNYEKLLAALKDGRTSQTGKKHSSSDVSDSQQTKLF